MENTEKPAYVIELADTDRLKCASEVPSHDRAIYRACIYRYTENGLKRLVDLVEGRADDIEKYLFARGHVARMRDFSSARQHWIDRLTKPEPEEKKRDRRLTYNYGMTLGNLDKAAKLLEEGLRKEARAVLVLDFSSLHRAARFATGSDKDVNEHYLVLNAMETLVARDTTEELLEDIPLVVEVVKGILAER